MKLEIYPHKIIKKIKKNINNLLAFIYLFLLHSGRFECEYLIAAVLCHLKTSFPFRQYVSQSRLTLVNHAYYEQTVSKGRCWSLLIENNRDRDQIFMFKSA